MLALPLSFSLSLFAIANQNLPQKLGKNPKDYPNPDSMPQVQVALRAIAAGKFARINDVISYIMTSTASSGISPSEPTARRAFAPAEVCKPGSALQPDVDWYLYKQIFPPIERLCAPIDGTDAVQLAECLGLDTKKYSIGSHAGAAGAGTDARELCPLESQIPDSIRFQDCAPLSLRCRSCARSFAFEGLVASVQHVTPEGIRCASAECGALLSGLSIVAQLEAAIRRATSRYYEGWLVCDDSSCGNRTRQMSVYGHRCLGPRGRAEGCLGRMRYEMGEREMYNQLLFFRSLWDVDGRGVEERLKEREKEDKAGAIELKEKVKAVGEWNRERFETCRAVVEGYLGKCGRVWVQMDGLFGFMMK